MSNEPRLKWTRGLVGYAIPLVIGVGFVLLIIIGATAMM